MRILLSAVGTRGDVQPLLALALELRALGHLARLCIPPNFLDWARDLEFEARPLGISMRPGPIPNPMPDLITDQFETLMEASQDCQLILGAGTHQYAARSIAQIRDIPCLQAVYAPQSFQDRAVWNARSLERVNANRRRLGLADISDVLDHILDDDPWLAADPTLCPPGRGAWILDDQSPLAPELEAFLEQGPPPVYLGFGSMPVPSETSAPLMAAARAHGRRLILAQGWAGLMPADPAADCFSCGDVNQQRLFPRLAAVVHHGGAGTTTTAARAGVPQVLVPMFSDQFYWGERVRALGLGVSTSLDHLPEALGESLGRNVQPIPHTGCRLRELLKRSGIS
ncbi:MAG: glycosyltransferase [Candidatus Eremiobacteraeota bacterium]|nr:glycosyltransferase [Candidatus Eremiobacteraeota bacterium]MCW5866973.1 glycosyltransferase [Candidatus Eremiobacteraeota bacterium]